MEEDDEYILSNLEDMSVDIASGKTEYSDIESKPPNDFFTITEVVAKHREKQYKSLDAFLNEASITNGDQVYNLARLVRGLPQRPKKRRKTSDERPIVVVKLKVNDEGKVKTATLKALLDSGGSGTLISKKFADRLPEAPADGTKTVWTTPGGELTTTKQVVAQFLMPELHDNVLIERKVHVTKSLGAYDMIIGRDAMSDLGIDILFSAKTVTWDGVSIPFRDPDMDVHQLYHVSDSPAVTESVSRIKKILDAKYAPADLDQIADSATHLDPLERDMLKELFRKHEKLFDGTLGNWKGQSLKLELKEDATPYHA